MGMMTFSVCEMKLKSERKLQTIRRRPRTVGEDLHIWFGNPRFSRRAEKLGIGVCVECFPIVIKRDGAAFRDYGENGWRKLNHREKLRIAKADGFGSWRELLEALEKLNGDFSGQWYVIRWKWKKKMWRRALNSQDRMFAIQRLMELNIDMDWYWSLPSWQRHYINKKVRYWRKYKAVTKRGKKREVKVRLRNGTEIELFKLLERPFPEAVKFSRELVNYG